MNECSFRTAEPGDAAAIAELIYLADTAHYDRSGYALSIGGTREHQFGVIEKLAATRAHSIFHHSHFDVGIAGGQVVAGAAGFDKISSDREMVAALEETGWSETDIAAMEGRIGELAACFPTEREGYWTLDHVAAMPGWRRLGLTRVALERVLERGRLLGFCDAKVDVFRGNAAARALYESFGFQLSQTFGEEIFARVLQRDALERLTMRL